MLASETQGLSPLSLLLSNSLSLSLSLSLFFHAIYIYMCVCVHIYIYIYNSPFWSVFDFCLLFVRIWENSIKLTQNNLTAFSKVSTLWKSFETKKLSKQETILRLDYIIFIYLFCCFCFLIFFFFIYVLHKWGYSFSSIWSAIFSSNMAASAHVRLHARFLMFINIQDNFLHFNWRVILHWV